MLIFQFPGQGSQSVGMGAALAAQFPLAKSVFDEVDEALGQHLFDMMANGPSEDLLLTENAQPAIMAVSIAVQRVLDAECGIGIEKASFVCGHSLGEYSALTAAGTFTLSDSAKALKLRGQAMQAAVPAGLGAMASLIGPKVDIALAESAAAEGAKVGVCVVANDNNGGNVVISGEKAAVDAAIEAAKAMGARAIPLAVSAPFHCPLMGPAAEKMAAALAAIDLKAPKAPVLANISVAPETDPEKIRDLLVQQVTGRVRWRESISALAQLAADKGQQAIFAELGSGSVLTGMSKRIAPDANSLAVNDLAGMDALKNLLLAQ